MEIVEKTILLENIDLLSLLGYNDEYLHIIENRFHALITVRGNSLILKGIQKEVNEIEKVFKELIYMLRKNGELNVADVNSVINFLDSNSDKHSKVNGAGDTVIYQGFKEIIKARSPKQLEYYNAVLNNDLVFAIGPAGTGKTFLAVAIALSFFKKNLIQKIILSRPAVEAGESLGFLPGDLKEKLDPYLRPLTDALFDMLSADKLKSYMEKNIIEIIPLAYMRGRTLNNSFIILDEAQNATITQMKMFLTRLGVNSKAIVTGDITQIDLTNKDNSGLVHCKKILQDIEGIQFVYFGNRDIVRHKLVAEIIRAYENDNGSRKEVENGSKNSNENDLFVENS